MMTELYYIYLIEFALLGKMILDWRSNGTPWKYRIWCLEHRKCVCGERERKRERVQWLILSSLAGGVRRH